jgi:Raf kinase inhibitor-like YbhB/YbcL family protein
MEMISPAFSNDQRIPATYSGDGAGMSPPLVWSRVPSGAQSYALVCENPDASIREPRVHWILCNIPSKMTMLPEGISRLEHPPEITGAKQGVNDFGMTGYGGPLPRTNGNKHRYFFRVYALDTVLKLSDRVTNRDLQAAMRGHILAWAELIGTYGA